MKSYNDSFLLKSEKIKTRPGIKAAGTLFAAVLLIVSGGGCKKLVEAGPPTTSITNTDVYRSDATAIAVLTGIYTYLSTGSFAQGPNGLSYNAGLSADEFSGTALDLGPVATEFYQNNLNSQQNLTSWETFYSNIYKVNAALEGISSSTTLTPAVKTQLTGECHFFRGFVYFYLVNLYGDVPLVTSSNYQQNAVLSRSPQALVWQQIIADLTTAQGLLSENYLNGGLTGTSAVRARPAKGAASALLARAYLYTGDWKDAEIQSGNVINDGQYVLSQDLNAVFLTSSTEAIWQLPPVDANVNTYDGALFIINSQPSGQPYLSPNLLNAFEPGDHRKTDWISSWTDSTVAAGNTYFFPFKYKVKSSATVTEYLMVLRLAEQYLIRAEAEASQNNLTPAVADLNVIRNRAGLANYNGLVDKASIVTAILHERQVELFSEWGHRWLDLKRSGTVNAVMSLVCPQKGGTWNSNWQLYPLPVEDLQTDQNLKQNPGY